MAFVQTISPGFVPDNYFDQDNIDFIQKKIIDVLHYEFQQSIVIPKRDIVRLMQRVLEERLESIPKMNQRVIMYATNDFRTHQIQANKHLSWESNYVYSQRLYDPTVARGPDLLKIKLNTKSSGYPSARFYFT